jgi:nucleoside phosphorylase
MARKTVPRSTFVDYSVGWICALPQEFAAARAMLDEEHGVPESRNAADRNVYALGRMGAHNVVIACLPAGLPGATPAATVATDMQRTFKHLRFGLLVGVGSGAPSAADDVRLGDVVVSRPTHDSGGVIQFQQALLNDVGHRRDRFVRGECLNAPPTVLLTAQSSLETEHMLHGSRICDFLAEAAQRYPRMKPQFAPPLARRGGSSHNNGCNDECDDGDKLFEASYVHQGGDSSDGICGQCDARRRLQRPAREPSGPLVHYGVIASGDEEIGCGVTRDAAKQALGVLCFEREAAGLMNNFPCLVIRGICDYSDSHKSKVWLGYAAAAAAACAKELLEMMPPQEVQDMATIEKVLCDGESSSSITYIYLTILTKSTMLVHTIVTGLRDSDSVAREGMAT